MKYDMQDAPWIVILTGPNGAGKSTFYDKVINEWDEFRNVQFVNMDNYAKYMAKPSENVEDYLLQASRFVKCTIDDNLEKKRSFVYETTASGLTHLRIMERAKKEGYNIATIFIGLSDVELSHLRVQKRVSEGGHNVPPEDINRRYPNILKNLPALLERSDIFAIFDNSHKKPFQLILFADKEDIMYFQEYPEWLNTALKGRKTYKNFIKMTPQDIKKIQKDSVEFAKIVFAKKVTKKDINK